MVALSQEKKIQDGVGGAGPRQATNRLQALAAAVQAALRIALGLARVLVPGILWARSMPWEAHGAKNSANRKGAPLQGLEAPLDPLADA